jgi:protein KTI12
MPLIMFSGLPSSGKTTRALELQMALETKIDSSLRKFKVHIVNDDSLGINREVYRGTSYIILCLLHIFTVHIMGSFSRQTLMTEARTEKAARGTFYSAVQRLLSKDDIVIADGLNYIKGFRYQLFCEAKALSTPHCVVIPALAPC